MSTTARTLTWLHLSDLHRCSSRDGGGGEIGLERLRDDLKALRDEQGLCPDLVFVTGDLAFGQTPDQPLAAQLREGWSWLREVLALYELKDDAVFLVPGNHDVDRGEVHEKDQEWLRGLAVRYDKERIRKLLQDGGREWRDYMRRLADFEAFVAECCPHLKDDGGRCTYGLVREVADLKVGIAGFNSAWSCGTDEDKGNLWLCEWQVDELAAKLLDADVRVALVHHPLSWLVESEDPGLKTRFQAGFHVFLHGHEHQSWVETPHHDHLHVAAGAVLDGADATLGYNVVRFDLDEGEGEVWVRTFDRRVDRVGTTANPSAATISSPESSRSAAFARASTPRSSATTPRTA